MIRHISRFSVALMAIALCQPSSAGILVNVLENADPAPGVKSFTVQLQGTDGANVSTVSGFELVGVHQVWENALGNGDTPRQGDTNGTFGNPAWGAFDTFIKTIPGFNTSPNWLPVETNDGSNPAGISLLPGNPAFAAFPGTAGIGTLRFTDSSNPDNDLASGIAFLAPQPSSVDFLQVVVPEGATASLSMIVEDSTTARTVVQDLPIGGVVEMDPILGPGGILSYSFNGETQSLTLENTGTADVVFGAPSISGPDAGLFSLVNPDLSDLAPGLTRNFDVKFAGNIPNEFATYTAALTFASNSVGGDVVWDLTATVPEPSTVALAGLGLVGLVGFARRRNG